MITTKYTSIKVYIFEEILSTSFIKNFYRQVQIQLSFACIFLSRLLWYDSIFFYFDNLITTT